MLSPVFSSSPASQASALGTIRRRAVVFVFGGLCLAATAQAQPKPGAAAGKPAGPAAVVTPMETFTLAQATAGLKGGGPLFATIELEQNKKPLASLRCELFTNLTPNTVAHFVGLARGLRPFVAPERRTEKLWVRRPLYDGSWMHRLLPDYLIQGGDPACAALHECGGLFGQGDAGFSIPDEIRPELRFDRGGRLALANKGPGTGSAQFFITERPTPWLNNTATIFGQCEPQDAISSIARLPTKPMNLPQDPVIIKRVTVAFGQVAGAAQGAAGAGKAVPNPASKP
ncbi:MAG: peptidylprolyl isomerase [Myxococcales bacterium]|nr:peptidylprolyl isomerase [Myxococcales bacterium]